MSATCLVLKAFDEEEKDEAINPRLVALKLLGYKTHFLREIQSRSVGLTKSMSSTSLKPSHPLLK